MTFDEFLSQLIQNRLSQVKVALVCKIDKINKSKNQADLVPIAKDGKSSMGVIADCPISFLTSGDYFIQQDYKAGDKVLVLFPSNALHQAIKGNKEEMLNLFGLENAIILSGVSDSSKSDKDGLVIAHKSGFPVINLNSSQITIQTTSATVKLTSSAVEIESTNITIKGTSKITLDGEVEVKKKLTCKDEISATKSITSDEDVKAGAISLKTHTHTGNLGVPTSPPQ